MENSTSSTVLYSPPLQSVLNADKMNALFPQETVRAVAHDLRNPLGGIYSLLKVFMEDGDFNRDQIETLTLITETASYSLKLVDTLLKPEHSDHTNYQDVNEVVPSCIKILTHKALQKNQQLTFIASSQSAMVNICRNKLARIIDNLISNAIKFTPWGGKIGITISETEHHIQVSVQDNGIGIPENLQQNLFAAPDKTGREGTDGEQSFGLGLPICKQIIDDNGGKIWFSSIPEKGTTFYFTLPKPELTICTLVA